MHHQEFNQPLCLDLEVCSLQLAEQAQRLNFSLPSLLFGLFHCLLHLLDLGEEITVAFADISINSQFNPQQSLGDYLKQHQAQVQLANLQTQLEQSQSPQLHFLNDQNLVALTLEINFQSSGEIRFGFATDEAYFTPTMIKSLADCYSKLLQNWNTRYVLPLTDIDYISEEQSQLIRHKAQFTPYEGQISLSEALWNSLQNPGDSLAIKDGDHAITYSELHLVSSRIAAALKARVGNVGTGIGICMNKSWQCIAAMLGVLFSGHYYIPLDKRNPKERQDYIIADAGISHLITDEMSQQEGALLFDDLLIDTDKPVTSEVVVNDLAYIIYTSGTTGKPKGVPIRQKSVMSLFDSCTPWLEFKSSDSWSWFHSFAFDFSVWEILGALLHGARVVVVDERTTANMHEFAKFLEDERISMVSLTPTALSNLLHAQSKAAFTPRYIFMGGEAFTADLFGLWQQKGNGQTQLINMYGITEITVHATVYPIEEDENRIAIGQGLKDTGLQILGSYQQALPLGFVGELAISGEGLSPGYWNLKDYSAKKFVAIKGQKRYLSGDLASLEPNGLFYYHGRKDKQFKLNGHRLERDDIIGALLRVPGINQVELKICQAESGIQFLCAYYLAAQPIADEVIRQELSKSLPNYAYPAHYIHLDSLPLTVNGKIDVNALPDPVLSIGVDEPEASVSVRLKQIWERVLQLELNAPFGDPLFFELGGNSLKSAMLCERIAHVFDPIPFNMTDLFRNPRFNQQEGLISKRMQTNLEV